MHRRKPSTASIGRRTASGGKSTLTRPRTTTCAAVTGARRRSDAQLAQVFAIRALPCDHRLGGVGGAKRLVLLDDEPAAVAVPRERREHAIDARVAIAEGAEHALRQRVVEGSTLGRHLES